MPSDRPPDPLPRRRWWKRQFLPAFLRNVGQALETWADRLEQRFAPPASTLPGEPRRDPIARLLRLGLWIGFRSGGWLGLGLLILGLGAWFWLSGAAPGQFPASLSPGGLGAWVMGQSGAGQSGAGQSGAGQSGMEPIAPDPAAPSPRDLATDADNPGALSLDGDLASSSGNSPENPATNPLGAEIWEITLRQSAQPLDFDNLYGHQQTPRSGDLPLIALDPDRLEDLATLDPSLFPTSPATAPSDPPEPTLGPELSPPIRADYPPENGLGTPGDYSPEANPQETRFFDPISYPFPPLGSLGVQTKPLGPPVPTAETLYLNPLGPPLPPTPQSRLLRQLRHPAPPVHPGASLSQGIESITPDFDRRHLQIQISTIWYALGVAQQDQWIAQLQRQSQNLGFATLEIRDRQGTLIGRSPVVGSGMVIWQR